jgi:cellulose synthase/poly-beta-1,6-N-acetylglucosamine synthase-like glycosyltransferase
LNERLVFGMAPDHIADVMTQRLRWAMGSLQILMRDNPLRLVGIWAGEWMFGGLTLIQRHVMEPAHTRIKCVHLLHSHLQ